MKNLSMVKVIAALVIVGCYMFSCGVVGNIGGAVKTSDPASDADGTGTTEAIGEAMGDGTLDFLVPDETGTGLVDLKLFNMTPVPLSDRVVQSTYRTLTESQPEPTEGTEEILGTEDGTSEAGTDEIVITLPEETEEAPVVTSTSAATSTTQTTTQTTTTTQQSTTSEPTEVSNDPIDDNSNANQGIPVDEPASDDEPDEIEPDDPTSDSTAAGEILYVRSNGGVVSGTALEITARMTQHEVGYTFAPEAIKAQAVAAYTYVKFCNEYGTYPSVGLSSTVSDSVEVLVESVIGQAIYYNGSIIQSVYSASSAGYSASSMNVWGTDYPYLESRFCDLDSKYDPNYGKTAQFSSDDIKSRVLSATGIELTGDPSGWLTIEARVDGNYVGQMSVGGYHSYTDSSGSTVKITGRTFREKIMGFDLRSSSFDVAYDSASDMFTFTTYGYGHGVGLSQNGANALATYLGYDYKQILTYYYKDTEVK